MTSKKQSLRAGLRLAIGTDTESGGAAPFQPVVPAGNPLKDIAVVLSIAFLGAGVGAGFLLVRWQRRNAAERAKEEAKAKKRKNKRDELDDRIDAELEQL